MDDTRATFERLSTSRGEIPARLAEPQTSSSCGAIPNASAVSTSPTSSPRTPLSLPTWRRCSPGSRTDPSPCTLTSIAAGSRPSSRRGGKGSGLGQRDPPRLIAPHPLSPQQFEEKADGFALVVERMLHCSAHRPDAPPASHEPRLPEQRFFDRQRIEPRHVAARVSAFDIELIGLRDHGDQNRASRLPRPMIGLNHRTWIDSFS
jgi:hypothetical protein